MRVKLEFPKPTIFSAAVPIRATDMNYGNHLGNDRFLTLAQEARVQWLAYLGYSELAIEGVGLIMADAAIQFLAEGRYGDELQIDLAVAELKSSSFNLYYRFMGLRSGEVLELARVKTAMVFFDYSLKKVVEMPSLFREKLGNFLSLNT